jgi:hypothetical protein
MAAEHIPVEVACGVLDVSVSGYYAWRSRPPSQRSIRHAWLTDLIVQMHQDSRGTYEALRVHAELRRHCCIEPEGPDEAWRGGGSPHLENAERYPNHSIGAIVCRDSVAEWRQPDGVSAQCTAPPQDVQNLICVLEATLKGPVARLPVSELDDGLEGPSSYNARRRHQARCAGQR